MSYKFPDNLHYADTHEYVLEEKGLLKIGVSEFAIDQLGDIVFVELADSGATLQKGETFGTIESVKAVEEVYLPFQEKLYLSMRMLLIILKYCRMIQLVRVG